MPELPEVETVRAGLEQHVVGRTVAAAEVFNPRAVRRDVAGPEGFAAAMAGRTLLRAERRGKYLWLALDSGTGTELPASANAAPDTSANAQVGAVTADAHPAVTADAHPAVTADAHPAVTADEALLAHLGMSGQLLVGDPDRPLSPHVRARFTFTDGGPDLRFTDQRTFGHLMLVPFISSNHVSRPAHGSSRAQLPSPADLPTAANPGDVPADLSNARFTPREPVERAFDRPAALGGEGTALGGEGTAAGREGAAAVAVPVRLAEGGRLVPAPIAHIAPDPLEPDFDPEVFAARLTRRKTGIKRALLDQSLVSGIGNIYADEALWRAKLHWARPTETLRPREVSRLLTAVRDVLTEALKLGGTSFDALYVNVNGESGYFDRSLDAYGRAGEPCGRCGTPIRRDSFMNRSAYSCPRCQPRPRHARW